VARYNGWVTEPHETKPEQPENSTAPSVQEILEDVDITNSIEVLGAIVRLTLEEEKARRVAEQKETEQDM
jgi:hypothetical protein